MTKPLSIYRTDAHPGSVHDAGSRVPGTDELLSPLGCAGECGRTAPPPPCATEEIDSIGQCLIGVVGACLGLILVCVWMGW